MHYYHNLYPHRVARGARAAAFRPISIPMPIPIACTYTFALPAPLPMPTPTPTPTPIPITIPSGLPAPLRGLLCEGGHAVLRYH